ncbi:MAG: UvrB/UvrC motif-containing protein [Clostridia bacterium]|nr:UvrB/UvrC motif-containing protein [Clostridia bacterium]
MMFDGFENARKALGSEMSGFVGAFGFDEFEDRMCPMCKTHESDIKETGVVGCVNCFKVFRDTISRAAYKIHGRLEHLGRVPQKIVSEAEKEREIQELRVKMQECAAKEDFEGANAYKRKIEQIKGEN